MLDRRNVLMLVITYDILLSMSFQFVHQFSDVDKTVQLWNLGTDQPIGTPLHYESYVTSATFYADGKFLVTSCNNGHLYLSDVSAIVKEAGLPSDIVSFNTFYSHLQRQRICSPRLMQHRDQPQK
jgi:WD40 repeat protein